MKRFLLLGAATLALGACKLDKTPQTGDQAEVTAGAPFALMLAPAYEALPPAPQMVPVAYAPQPVAQQYWDDAYLTSYDYYNQPPAYFNYSGATPLVWSAPNSNGDLITRIVEAIVGGGMREYFYQPQSDYPYFVRDPQYAYAYDPQGRLVAVYDPYGQPLDQSLVVQRVPYASSYLLRADNLRDAAIQAALVQLAPDVWNTQRTLLVRDLDDNDEERAWRTWWAPRDDRTVIQRVTEIREREAKRGGPSARALAVADVNGVGSINHRAEHAGGPKAKFDDHPGRGSGKVEDHKPAKVEKRAEVSHGPSMKGGKSDDHGGGKAKAADHGNGGGKSDHGGGNGKGGGGGNGHGGGNGKK